MATFIEATEHGKNGAKVTINLDQVTQMSRVESGDVAYTHILFGAGAYTGSSWLWQRAQVEETPEQLLRLAKEIKRGVQSGAVGDAVSKGWN